jgi:hypothetical protein
MLRFFYALQILQKTFSATKPVAFFADESFCNKTCCKTFGMDFLQQDKDNG